MKGVVVGGRWREEGLGEVGGGRVTIIKSFVSVTASGRPSSLSLSA